MKECFTPKTFNADHLAIIATANSIIEDYLRQGYRLTLRQLYYQFVARDLLANTERNYKKLGNVISAAREAGLVDWEAIEDRGRSLRRWPSYRNGKDFLKQMRRRFMVDLLEGQEYYVEVWVEKAALEGVIERACSQLRVPHFACRGYNSASAAYEAGKRFEQRIDEGQHVVVLHLGDHDPSGLDMSRDNEQRNAMFANARHHEIELRRLALNMDQVEQYDPPPNPAKLSDSRATTYTMEHGYESWELDALDPSVIVDLVRAELDELIDMDLVEDRREFEAEQDEKLGDIIDQWSE